MLHRHRLLPALRLPSSCRVGRAQRARPGTSSCTTITCRACPSTLSDLVASTAGRRPSGSRPASAAASPPAASVIVWPSFGLDGDLSPSCSTSTFWPSGLDGAFDRGLGRAFARRLAAGGERERRRARRRTAHQATALRIAGDSTAVGDLSEPTARSAAQPASSARSVRLQAPPFGVEIVALVAPCREARFDLAPERARMVGVEQVAELVHQHVLERRRPRQHQRQVQRDSVPSGASEPHCDDITLNCTRRGGARQCRQVARQPAADVGARLRLRRNRAARAAARHRRRARACVNSSSPSRIEFAAA